MADVRSRRVRLREGTRRVWPENLAISAVQFAALLANARNSRESEDSLARDSRHTLQEEIIASWKSDDSRHSPMLFSRWLPPLRTTRSISLSLTRLIILTRVVPRVEAGARRNSEAGNALTRPRHVARTRAAENSAADRATGIGRLDIYRAPRVSRSERSEREFIRF